MSIGKCSAAAYRVKYKLEKNIPPYFNFKLKVNRKVFNSFLYPEIYNSCRKIMIYDNNDKNSLLKGKNKSFIFFTFITIFNQNS